MKVILKPTAGTVVEIEDTEGNKHKFKVKQMSLTPFFTSSQSQATFLDGRSVAASGAVVDKFILTAAGSTGKVARKDRKPAQKKSVTPLIDKREKKKETEDEPDNSSKAV